MGVEYQTGFWVGTSALANTLFLGWAWGESIFFWDTDDISQQLKLGQPSDGP